MRSNLIMYKLFLQKKVDPKGRWFSKCGTFMWTPKFGRPSFCDQPVNRLLNCGNPFLQQSAPSSHRTNPNCSLLLKVRESVSDDIEVRDVYIYSHAVETPPRLCLRCVLPELWGLGSRPFTRVRVTSFTHEKIYGTTQEFRGRAVHQSDGEDTIRTASLFEAERESWWMRLKLSWKP